jgi:hypothetical protein
MYVAVQHRIKDPQTAMARGDILLKGEGAPPGVQVREFYLSQDQALATCLWEGGSVGAVQGYVDSTLGDSAENFFFQVDGEHSLGLPE